MTHREIPLGGTGWNNKECKTDHTLEPLIRLQNLEILIKANFNPCTWFAAKKAVLVCCKGKWVW